MKHTEIENVQFRVGKWLPSDQLLLEKWLEGLVEEVDDNTKPLHPVIEAFKELIEHDAEIFMLFNQMFEQVPAKYNMSPTGKPQVRDYHHMLKMINAVMTKAPEFDSSGLVGLPINAILDWSMGTTGGFAAFLNKKVNIQLKRILNEWGIFLKSSDSCDVLTDKGWLGEEALKALAAMDPYAQENSPDPKQNFIDNFKCDTGKPYWGFTSWDDFFTREFKEGKRPVASPEDDRVIVNACEAAPYRIATNVKRRAKFWIKAQPYSLEHMLANDELVEKFIGGTVYQAFLSAKSYHRWHSPVNGTIVKAYVQDGTYYSETLTEAYDPSGNKESQGYITEVATRALIFIEADNPDIGLMCVMPVGMAEVSSCEITVYEGQKVKKGEQLGSFHFGGSTHCLFFGPHVKLEFDLHGQTPGLTSTNIPVNARIATVQGY
ncbi:MAG: phosphatidylserine decarboxylase family protein [Sulfuricurvum sp.]